MRQEEFLARVIDLNTVLDGVGLEDFTVTNENRAVTDVAHELLARAGWP